MIHATVTTIYGKTIETTFASMEHAQRRIYTTIETRFTHERIRSIEAGGHSFHAEVLPVTAKVGLIKADGELETGFHIVDLETMIPFGIVPMKIKKAKEVCNLLQGVIDRHNVAGSLLQAMQDNRQLFVELLKVRNEANGGIFS